jgi:hypothetical protein
LTLNRNIFLSSTYFEKIFVKLNNLNIEFRVLQVAIRAWFIQSDCLGYMSIRAGLYSRTDERGVGRVCVTLILFCDLIFVVTLDLELMVVVCVLKIWKQYFMSQDLKCSSDLKS